MVPPEKSRRGSNHANQEISFRRPKATTSSEIETPPAYLSCSERKRRKGLLVALIDSRPLIRESLAYRLRVLRRDCEIILFAAVDDFLRYSNAEAEVDLVLIGARSSDVVSGEIVKVVEQLCAASPGERVIIISDRDEAEAVAATLRHGARGYIPTSLDPSVAFAALEVVLAGGIFAPAATLIRDAYAAIETPTTSARIESVRPEAPGSPGETFAGAVLTARELEVLACLSKGQSNKAIARTLDMREGTVKVHLRHLMRKLNASNRTQLALRADRLEPAEPSFPSGIVGCTSNDPSAD